MDELLSDQGAVQRDSAEQVMDWGCRLASELDPRLADVWACLFNMDSNLSMEEIAWFLRMAYLNGYEDGLTETNRGALLEQLGMAVPRRGSAKTQGRGGQ
jgi:hypothetical protein